MKKATKLGAEVYTGRKYVYYDLLLFLLSAIDGQEREDYFHRDPDDPDPVNTAEGTDATQKTETGQEEWDYGERVESEAAKNARQVEKNKPQIRSQNKKLSPVEAKMSEMLEEKPEKPNRHASFFDGIIPSLENFADDEVLDVQQGVLSLIQSIKKKHNCPPSFSTESPRAPFSPYQYSRVRPYPRSHSAEPCIMK